MTADGFLQIPYVYYVYLCLQMGYDCVEMENNIEAVLDTPLQTVVLVVVSLILGLLAIKLLLILLKRLLLVSSLDNAIVRFVTTSIRVLLWVALLLHCMQLLDIPLGSMIALLSAIGVAIGLAIQDSIANVANGLVMIMTRPFKVGDYVRIGDDEGTIEELRLMNTVLSTAENKKLILPNKTVFTSRIVNFNTNPIRRIELFFSVDYSTDLDKAIAVTEKACHSCQTVLSSPSPRVELSRAAASSLDILVWVWCSSAEYWNTYFAVERAVFDAYKAEKIEIPFDQVTVSMRKDSPSRRPRTVKTEASK